jgi:hypothetical protein
MNVPATLEFPCEVFMMRDGMEPPPEGVAIVGNRLYVHGVHIGDGAWIDHVDATRVHVAGNEKPVEVIVNSTRVNCEVVYGRPE